MILVFDTETTGFPKERLPVDHFSQPYMIEIGAVVMDKNWVERASLQLLVRPEGWEIPQDLPDRVHGISTAYAIEHGIRLEEVLPPLFALRQIVDEVAAFNLKFDLRILATAIARAGYTPSAPIARHCCVMETAQPIINLPPTDKMLAKGMKGPKRPSLKEAHLHFFGTEVEGAHGALADARAAARVLQAIRCSN